MNQSAHQHPPRSSALADLPTIVFDFVDDPAIFTEGGTPASDEPTVIRLVARRSGDDLDLTSTLEFFVSPYFIRRQTALDPVGADATDFAGGVLPSGVFVFAPGATRAFAEFSTATDLAFEVPKLFEVLVGAIENATYAGGPFAPRSAILNDDAPEGLIVLSPGDDGAGFSLVGSGVEVDALTGDDNVIGSAFDDLIRGRKGRDSLDGGDGDDELRGGNGNDVLTAGSGRDRLLGGRGSDAFILTGDDTVDPAAGRPFTDRILDFSSRAGGAPDRIEFQGFTIGATLALVRSVASDPTKFIYSVLGAGGDELARFRLDTIDGEPLDALDYRFINAVSDAPLI